MRYWTWGEIREKIENEFDLQEEPDILSTGELCGYLNDAIDSVEQHFIKLGDYFYSISDPITVVAGTKDYVLPEKIYANKIRQIIYDGEYEVRPIKNVKNIPFISDSTGSDYTYKIVNNPGERPKIRLFPTPTSSGELEIHYTRNAAQIDPDGDDDQEIDIPEANLYIHHYIKMKIYEKEKNYQMFESYKGIIEEVEKDLIDALDAQLDDESNTIDPDVEIYQDMIGGFDHV
jgi:hypothetical protein